MQHIIHGLREIFREILFFLLMWWKYVSVFQDYKNVKRNLGEKQHVSIPHIQIVLRVYNSVCNDKSHLISRSV